MPVKHPSKLRLANWRNLEKHPPPIVGQITLDVYDHELWNALSADATERKMPLALYLHSMLQSLAAHNRRVIEWRREQDARDPDLVEIRRYLEEFAPEHKAS